MRIIVSGPIANKLGNGGIAWNVLSYVRGLQQLGHDVAFVESIAPDACTTTASTSTAPHALKSPKQHDTPTCW